RWCVNTRRNYHMVQKLDSTRYRQWHWVDGGLNQKTYWQLGKPKGPDIRYFLPELNDAPPQQLIFIAEGEKDTETLIDLGLVATTNPGGAGKWNADLNQWFAGKRRVVILEDNDAAGRAHVRKVAQHLHEIVDEVRILRLPNLPEHGDVTDWLENGGT